MVSFLYLTLIKTYRFIACVLAATSIQSPYQPGLSFFLSKLIAQTNQQQNQSLSSYRETGKREAYRLFRTSFVRLKVSAQPSQNPLHQVISCRVDFKSNSRQFSDSTGPSIYNLNSFDRSILFSSDYSVCNEPGLASFCWPSLVLP